MQGAFQSDINKQKVLREGVNDKYYDANDVPKMSILSSDNSSSTTVNAVSTGDLRVDDTSSGARLLSSGVYGTLGLDFLKSQ